MGNWEMLAIQVKAGTARTHITHQTRGKPHEYNRQMLEFIEMCLNSGIDDAVKVGEQLYTWHIEWQMKNGLFK